MKEKKKSTKLKNHTQTIIVNFPQLDKLLKISCNQDQNDIITNLLNYISNILKTTCYINQKGYLVLDKNFKPQDIEKVICEYLIKFKK